MPLTEAEQLRKQQAARIIRSCFNFKKEVLDKIVQNIDTDSSYILMLPYRVQALKDTRDSIYNDTTEAVITEEISATTKTDLDAFFNALDALSATVEDNASRFRLQFLANKQVHYPPLTGTPRDNLLAAINSILARFA